MSESVKMMGYLTPDYDHEGTYGLWATGVGGLLLHDGHLKSLGISAPESRRIPVEIEVRVVKAKRGRK